MAFLGWESKQDGRSIRIVPRSMNNWKFSTNCTYGWKNRLIVSWILRTLHSKRWRVLQIGRSRSILLSISAPQVGGQVSWFSDRPQGGILDRGGGSVVLGGKTGSAFGREVDACMGEGALQRNLM